MNKVCPDQNNIEFRFFKFELFEHFLKQLPADHELIMNGDIVDSPYVKMEASDQRILDLIKGMSFRRKEVWIRGNHDNGYLPQHFGSTIFKSSHSLDGRLLITHGDDFDDIMPRSRLFIRVFKLMHDLRVKMGAKPVHVAEYAKKWESFYRVLRKNVALNAVKCAVENGFEAVTCGHTHYPEDFLIDGVRYINTGAWTEFPAYYLHVVADEMTLNGVTPLFEPHRIFNKQVKQYASAIPFLDANRRPVDYN